VNTFLAKWKFKQVIAMQNRSIESVIENSSSLTLSTVRYVLHSRIIVANKFLGEENSTFPRRLFTYERVIPDCETEPHRKSIKQASKY
jgi:hypothetical protein